jgi:hypothetical protein
LKVLDKQLRVKASSCHRPGIKSKASSQASVAHVCNPCYLGGRSGGSGGSQFKASPGKPYLEKTLHKKGMVEWLKV